MAQCVSKTIVYASWRRSWATPEGITPTTEVIARISELNHTVSVDIKKTVLDATDKLILPDNIEFFFIQTDTPEVNPTEQIWKELKEYYFDNRFLFSF